MIGEIVKWIAENIFTLDPITSITIKDLFILYLAYFLIALLPALPFIIITKKKRKNITLPEILLGVPLEDALFRYLPLTLLGNQGAIYAHFIWALLHNRIGTIIFVVIHGLLDLRLWLGGLWVEAVFIHLFHDLVLFVITKNFGEEES